MTDLPTYVLERTFDAPRALVWRTWTEAKHLARWYGPNVETIVHKLDVQPGGLWLNEMKWGDHSHFQRAEYTEVIQPEGLVWLHAVCDADWNIAANPMMPNWPRILLTTVTFKEENGKTELRLTWVPHQASDAEVSCFSDAIAGMDKGWASGMQLLAELLAELQAS